MKTNQQFLFSKIEAGQPFTDTTFIVEAMGPVASENKSSSNAKEPEEDEPPMITFLLEEIILKHAKKPSRVTKNSTDEEKKADRLRRLNAKSTRWRIIFSQWPRDPNGKTITAENSCLGKMTPHRAQLWGATLFNFYSVRRFPNLMHLKTFSTGSKLAAWMKANGEDYAKSMLEFCENEPDPHVIQPYPISGLIQDGDAFMFEKSWIRDDGGGDDDDMSGKGKGKAREYWQVPQPVRSSTCLLFFVACIDGSYLLSGLLHPLLIPSHIPSLGQVNRSLRKSSALATPHFRNTSFTPTYPRFSKSTIHGAFFVPLVFIVMIMMKRRHGRR